jgi:hypothetical protein
MASISQALKDVKRYFTSYVPESLIVQVCQEVGHHWRDRELGPVATVHLFLQQILHGNTACSHLRFLSDQSVTASAYCQARARLPLQVATRLQNLVTGALRFGWRRRSHRWRGQRLFFLDGSSFSMPDTPPLQAHFGQPSNQTPGCGFPVAHLMVLFDHPTGFLRKALALPLETHDLAHTPALHTALRPGDVLVGDRAFGTYAHLALCFQRKIQGVFRANQSRIICFRPGRAYLPPDGDATDGIGLPRSRWLQRLGRHDQLVEYFKPPQCPTWMSPEQWQGLPDSFIVRELRYRIRVPGVRTRQITLVTTLVDAERYPAKVLAQLYAQRWQLEVDLRHLKQTMKMNVLRCKTLNGVLKELAFFVLVYNLVRSVMAAAAQRQRVDPNRISFVDALRWLQRGQPLDALPTLIVHPLRPGRFEPRVRKRRFTKYPVMKRPRDELRKVLLKKELAA